MFTLAQARAAGLSDEQIRYRRAHLWRKVAGPAYVGRAQPIGGLQFAWAAGLWRPDGIVVLDSAAHYHRIPGRWDTRGHLWLPSPRSGPSGLIVHRYAMASHPVAPYERLQVTRLRATILDLLARTPWPQAESLAAWAIARRKLSGDELRTALEHRNGTWGVRQLRRFVDRVTSQATSDAELRLHDLLRDAGIGGWRANQLVPVDELERVSVDIVFQEELLVLMVDGKRYHVETFQKDRTDHNSLVGAGYTVLHLTWDDITRRPAPTVDLIASTLARLRRSRAL